MGVKSKKFYCSLPCKLLLLLFSINLMAFSYALYLKAGLGSDVVSLLVDGLNATIGVSFGTASAAINFGLFLIVLICNRQVINIATIICVIFTSVFLDMNTYFLNAISLGEPFALWVRVLMPLVATVINAIGISAYLTLNLGASPFDGLVLSIAKLPCLTYKSAMYIVNILFFVSGVALGGTWGYGTIIAVVTSGFLFERTLKMMQKYLAPMINREKEFET